MKVDKFILGAIILTFVVFVGAGLLVWVQGSSPVPKEDTVSKKGLHWHPKLIILVKGEKQEIPPNIGIGGIHQPIHTHDDASDGVIHMEMKGLVTKEETKISKFFQTWGRQFNSNCIFDKCNGDEMVKMFVNGQENKDFENYLMKDGDKIEIKYE